MSKPFKHIHPKAALMLAGSLALASCGGAQDAQTATETDTASVPQPPETPDAVTPRTETSTTSAKVSGSSKVDVQTDLVSFEYSFPKTGNAKLDKYLKDKQEASLAEIKKDAAQAKTEAEKNDFPYRKYSTYVEWTKAGQSQHFISLYALGSYYTGGAHPNNGFTALLWDTTAGKKVEFEDLFVSRAKMKAALSARICGPIDRMREERRGMKKPANTDESFWDCPALSEVKLIPSNDGSGPFREIAVRIGPYVAGPYAEGNFEFALPVDKAFIAALNPEHGSEFAIPE